MGVTANCKIEGCAKLASQRGMCSMHYRRWYIHGDPHFTMREPPQPGRPCAVPGCDRPYEGLGYCKLHRRRFKKFGSTELPPKVKRICSECDGPAKARGFCEMHYQRWATHGDPANDGRPPPLPVRLQAGLVRTERGCPESDLNCLEWTGATLRGYGQIGDGGKVLYTHRAAFELAYGSIPEGLKVLHHCDNPPCCEPEHLFAGTDADNVADMIAKGRGHWQNRGAA